MTSAKFDLGQILSTPGALEALASAGQAPAEFLSRHAAADWGELDEEDRALNEQALIDGSRLLSVYRTSLNVRIWIITEAEDENGRRAATTILLPEQY
jgi:hypothetical protein